MTPTLRRTFWLALVLPVLGGCRSVPAPVAAGASPCAARAIVFVVDGAGGHQNAPRALASIIDEWHLPVYVRSFDWTHGGLGLADVVDADHSRCQGRRLADLIGRYRESFPGVPIYVVGFSAGAAVTLASADWLPPDSLERMVLLAPAVAARYDLRRALASARQGLDVFVSDRDRFWLGTATGIVGTADGTRDRAAGRVGFNSPCLSPADAALAQRLRQHPWTPCAAWTGNEGGHAGTLEPAYLKAYVLPLLTPPEPARALQR